MNSRLIASITVALSILGLSACGGGSNSSTAAAPTPATTAPAAATSSNQLANSVSVSGYSALSIASKTSSTMQTAGIKGLFQNLLARLITPAYAATCTTDARYAYGSAKYSGSGTQSNIPYSYYDLRGLVGYDFNFTELGGFVLAPFTGIGYRYLFDNQGGQTTSGANAYNRSSTYVYLPIGVTHRMKVNDTHKLETVFEYDYLIQGTQVSQLSQAAPYLPNVTNQQTSGYGLRLSSMYQFDAWSVGPYVTYWNIQNSNTVTQTITVNRENYRLTVYEPANNTIEAGIKVAYSF